MFYYPSAMRSASTDAVNLPANHEMECLIVAAESQALKRV